MDEIHPKWASGHQAFHASTAQEIEDTDNADVDLSGNSPKVRVVHRFKLSFHQSSARIQKVQPCGLIPQLLTNSTFAMITVSNAILIPS